MLSAILISHILLNRKIKVKLTLFSLILGYSAVLKVCIVSKVHSAKIRRICQISICIVYKRFENIVTGIFSNHWLFRGVKVSSKGEMEREGCVVLNEF